MPFDVNDLADDEARVLSEQGQSVSYTPDGGGASTITAIWDPDQTLPGYMSDGEQDVTVGVLLCKGTDVPSPGDRDKVVIGAVTYAVRTVERRRFFVALQLEARVQRRLGGDHSRIRREG